MVWGTLGSGDENQREVWGGRGDIRDGGPAEQVVRVRKGIGRLSRVGEKGEAEGMRRVGVMLFTERNGQAGTVPGPHSGKAGAAGPREGG